MTTIEEWRSVPSKPLLEASNIGRIRSIPYLDSAGVRIRQMSPTFGVTATAISKYSYRRKQITFRRRTYKVHRLVAEAFIGECPLGLDVSHKDENSLNNHVDNLEYVTRKVNLNMPRLKQFHSEVCRMKMNGVIGMRI